jgi:hypothetical protein
MIKVKKLKANPFLLCSGFPFQFEEEARTGKFQDE